MPESDIPDSTPLAAGNGDEGVESRADLGAPGRIGGRYVLRRLLGRGGFGAVYEALDEVDERVVALKLIREDASNIDPRGTRSRTVGSSPGSSGAFTRFAGSIRRPGTRSFVPSTPGRSQGNAEAFKDEFRLLTHLHHPNLAEVYDFGLADDVEGFYFTQELVEGPYLGEFLRGASREVIVDVFIQLARALDYIHTLGLLHEDIKPTNVLVTDAAGKAQAKLIDFGLARVLRTPADAKKGEEGGELTILGTPGFSAPEKVRGLKTDARSDIYSLAATIYTAALGRKPFPGGNFEDALKAQVDWRPELAGVLLPMCGPVVAELVGRMLSPDPEKRPQSARAIVLELLRREGAATSERDSKHDRGQFARVLVEHLPFIDRAGHLDILLSRASDVLVGETGEKASESSRSGSRARLIRSVVIEAPEGMGKSRLLTELRREVQLGGGMFVEGSYWTSDRSSLGAFAPIVVQVAAALGDRSVVVQQFASLVALARARGTDAARAAELVGFLLAASRERPFVLGLTELARGTETARFEQLVHAIDHESAPIFIVTTSVPNPKCSPVLAQLAREGAAEVWGLRPFTRREMFTVLQGVLGETPALGDIATMLDKLTGGHPLQFRETLRVLIEEQVLIREGDTWMLRASSSAAEDLHKSLAQRSEQRLDGLGVSAWEVGSILYLVEAPIDEDLLAELADLRKERFRRTLDRLEGEGLVMRTTMAGGGSTIALAHESVREAVRLRYSESLDETRLDLAGRIEELERDDAQLVMLRARLVDDAATGLESADALEQAAKDLIRHEQPQLAGQVLDRLIDRLRRHGGATGMRRLLDMLLLLRRHAQGAMDDPRRESRHYEAGILLSQLLGDHRAEATFWLGLADRHVTDVSGVDEILSRLEEAARAADRAEDRVLALRIANRRAEVLLSNGEIEQASAHARDAMAIIDIPEASDADVIHIIGVRLRCLALSGQLGEARRLHEMAKPIADRVPVQHRQSYLSGIAFLAVLGGDPKRSIPESEEAVRQLRELNAQRMLIVPLHNLGDLYLRNGEAERALEPFRECARLASLYGYEQSLHLNRGFLGYALARTGDPQEGAALLADAKTALSRMADGHVSLQQCRLLDAEVSHMLGNSAKARRELEEMLADFHASKEVALAHWAQDALARIERDLGHAFVAAAIPEEGDDIAPDEDTVRTKPVR
jgi:serine/threonine protein kinase/tetratricopeptide (TPR) repeat protein